MKKYAVIAALLALLTALAACGKDIPLTVQVVNIDGTLA